MVLESGWYRGCNSLGHDQTDFLYLQQENLLPLLQLGHDLPAHGLSRRGRHRHQRHLGRRLRRSHERRLGSWRLGRLRPGRLGPGRLGPGRLRRRHGHVRRRHARREEDCDDGNVDDFDGCSAMCETESIVWEQIASDGPSFVNGDIVDDGLGLLVFHTNSDDTYETWRLTGGNWLSISDPTLAYDGYPVPSLEYDHTNERSVLSSSTRRPPTTAACGASPTGSPGNRNRLDRAWSTTACAIAWCCSAASTAPPSSVTPGLPIRRLVGRRPAAQPRGSLRHVDGVRRRARPRGPLRRLPRAELCAERHRRPHPDVGVQRHRLGAHPHGADAGERALQPRGLRPGPRGSPSSSTATRVTCTSTTV